MAVLSRALRWASAAYSSQMESTSSASAIAHDKIAFCPSGSELVVIGPGRLRTIELGRARGAAGWRCTRPRTCRRSRLVQPGWQLSQNERRGASAGPRRLPHAAATPRSS